MAPAKRMARIRLGATDEEGEKWAPATAWENGEVQEAVGDAGRSEDR